MGGATSPSRGTAAAERAGARTAAPGEVPARRAGVADREGQRHHTGEGPRDTPSAQRQTAGAQGEAALSSSGALEFYSSVYFFASCLLLFFEWRDIF